MIGDQSNRANIQLQSAIIADCLLLLIGGRERATQKPDVPIEGHSSRAVVPGEQTVIRRCSSLSRPSSNCIKSEFHVAKRQCCWPTLMTLPMLHYQPLMDKQNKHVFASLDGDGVCVFIFKIKVHWFANIINDKQFDCTFAMWIRFFSLKTLCLNYQNQRNDIWRGT